MPQPGYYHSPTIHHNTIVFVSEDDLWTIPTPGGIARRLTANQGQADTPALSPDGLQLAFTGCDEGKPEVYCMPAEGGPATRLTWLGADTSVIGWTPDGHSIVFASNAQQHFYKLHALYTVPAQGGIPVKLPVGQAQSVSFGPTGGLVIGRNTTDLAHWKRYRGGLTGDLWIDPAGNGNWQRLISLNGNVAMPLWVENRIYFVSDHQGVGNLYSCLPTGDDLQQHTHHPDYYVRYPATDGSRIVYHAGADLYLFDPATNRTDQIPVQFYSPRVQRKRKFVAADEYLQDYALHPYGFAVALICRGKLFTMANWEGAVLQYGQPQGVRYRLAAWLYDGARLITLSDATGEERLEIHHLDDTTIPPDRLESLDLGRPHTLLPSPCADLVAVSNHRHELILVDLTTQTATILDRSPHQPLHGLAWSPDGRWLAYGFSATAQTSLIKLCRVETGQTWNITHPLLKDINPSFDPDGKYLYFISVRDFNPIYDNLHFNLNFPWGMRPCLVTLQADLPSPFDPVPRAPGEKIHGGYAEKETDESYKPDTFIEPDDADTNDTADYPPADGPRFTTPSTTATVESPLNNNRTSAEPDKEELPDNPPAVQIDLEGITNRVLAFPVPEGRYGQIWGLKEQVLFTSFPLENARDEDDDPGLPPPARGRLQIYSFENLHAETLIQGISNFSVTPNGKTLIYQAGRRLRVIKAGEKPHHPNESPSRKSGWLDLDRVKLLVEPHAEWQQMFREAWRMQRDHFWNEKMSGIDWQLVYRRYFLLLDRITTRTEFSDLLMEMQGELATSHAYELGGDYRPEPYYQQGFLGADLIVNPETGIYHLARILRGDDWNRRGGSPLAKPGLNLVPGDQLLAINGISLTKTTSPAEVLLNSGGSEVEITVLRQTEPEPRVFTIRTLTDETPLRYRVWVEDNRRRVHEASDGQIGYVHIPDMGAEGYAEFYRGYLAEVDRSGLIVDVRNNIGGHVSPLILEKLARRRLGYDVRRWGEPIPYPPEAVGGPIVALCNQFSASDGDMFSHAFKLMQLGTLVGVRTWGGVVGVDMHDSLVDGGITTQPEYSFWFNDVGWRIENYGVIPDVVVEITPQDYLSGRDPQLEKAIEIVRQALVDNPVSPPAFAPPRHLNLPEVP